MWVIYKAWRDTFKSFLENCVTNYDFREKQFYVNSKNKINYIFNSSIQGIEDSDFIILIGCNPRHEATILNASKKTFVSKTPIYSFEIQAILLTTIKLLATKQRILKNF